MGTAAVYDIAAKNVPGEQPGPPAPMMKRDRTGKRPQDSDPIRPVDHGLLVIGQRVRRETGVTVDHFTDQFRACRPGGPGKKIGGRLLDKGCCAILTDEINAFSAGGFFLLAVGIGPWSGKVQRRSPVRDIFPQKRGLYNHPCYDRSAHISRSSPCRAITVWPLPALRRKAHPSIGMSARCPQVGNEQPVFIF